MYTSLTPVSWENHQNMQFTPYSDYLFAQQAGAVAIGMSEITKAVASFPIAFISGPNNGLKLMAMLSINGSQNVFVSSDGKWMGGYIPAFFRGFPFAITSASDAPGKMVICMDMASGLIQENRSGIPLFDAPKKLSETLQKITHFLVEVNKDKARTDIACKTIKEKNILKPFTIQSGKAKQDQTLVKGFYQIDEDKLNALSDADFSALNKTGALKIAYAQLFSMERLAYLQHLAGMQAKESLQAKKLLENSFTWDQSHNSFQF